jgi:uncharacterized protein (DUF697 family)
MERSAETPADQQAEATDRVARAEAVRARAAQFMSERRFADARKALEEADALEAEPSKYNPQRVISALRSRLPKVPTLSSLRGKGTAEAQPAGSQGAESPDAETKAPETLLSPVDQSMAIVNLYSKIAAAVGLLPTGVLNFAGILAVQVTMVWKIANAFGHRESTDRVRGSVLSLIGSVVPTGIGHGMGVAIAAIPAIVAGTVVYFLLTPVLAYAMTRAVGNAYIMHFESGGTLLTFDPKAFRDYFLKEFQNAGGKIANAPDSAPAAG